jgi:hypothetical protein
MVAHNAETSDTADSSECYPDGNSQTFSPSDKASDDPQPYELSVSLSGDATSTSCSTRAHHEEVHGEVTLRLNPDSGRGISTFFYEMRATCAIRGKELTICKTNGEMGVLARVPLDKLQVTVWPNRPNLFGLASDCNDVVCCTDSEDIRNEWQAVFQQLGVDVATKLPEADDLVDSSKYWAVPAIDVAEKGLERGMAVEIQCGGVHAVRMALAKLRISIGRVLTSRHGQGQDSRRQARTGPVWYTG